MTAIFHWTGPAMLATALALGASILPARAQAEDLARVLVDIADVVMRGDTPYDRHGDYGHDDRLHKQRDRYGRTLYYRNSPVAYRDAKCNKHGKCKVEYYNPRYDRDRYQRDDRYYWDDRRGRRDQDRRWRDDDDDD